MKHGRERAAGALVALAIVIKPYAVLFLPWLAARRQPASSLAAAAGCALALALPLTLYGVDGNRRCCTANGGGPSPKRRRRTSWSTTTCRWRRCSSAGSARRVCRRGWPTRGASLLLAWPGSCSSAAAACDFPEGLEGGLLLTLMPLLSPQGWDYVFLIATPAIVYLANYDDQLPQPLRALTIAALAAIGLASST